MSESINSVIKDYLESPKTDYAIMISGEWGCGKSYYIEHAFSELVRGIDSPVKRETPKEKWFAKKEECPISYEKYEPALITLYGISSAEDFELRVFSGINAWIRRRFWRIAGFLGGKVAEFFGLTTNTKDLSELTTIKQNRVLVFDDLERICEDKIQIKEVLGLINSFAEHSHLKVIIVCNEDELLYEEKDSTEVENQAIESLKKDDDYKKYKEKSVRFTYKFTPDDSIVYDAMISELPEGDYKRFLIKDKTSILSLFRIGEKKNLRTLKFFIDTFGKIHVEACKSKHYHRIVRNYLVAHMLYAKEYKKGATIDDLQSLDESQYIIGDSSLWGVHKEEASETKKDYATVFRETYDTVYADFINSKVLLKYISSGSVDMDFLQKEIQNLENKYDKEQETEEGVVYNRLNNTAQLSDEEIQPLLEKLIEFIKSDRYNLYDLLYIYTLFLKYNYWHIGGFTISDEIDDLVLSSMERQKSKHVYNPMFEYKTPIWDDGAESKKEHDMYNAIKSMACKINREARVANEASECHQFIAVVENGDVNELRKYRMDGNNRMSVNGMDWDRIGNLILTAQNPIACELCECIIFLTPDAALVSVSEQERIKEKLIPVLDAFLKKQNGQLRVITITYLLKHLKEVTGMITRYGV